MRSTPFLRPPQEGGSPSTGKNTQTLPSSLTQYTSHPIHLGFGPRWKWDRGQAPSFSLMTDERVPIIHTRKEDTRRHPTFLTQAVSNISVSSSSSSSGQGVAAPPCRGRTSSPNDDKSHPDNLLPPTFPPRRTVTMCCALLEFDSPIRVLASSMRGAKRAPLPFAHRVHSRRASCRVS